MGRKCAYVLPIPTQSFNEMSQSSKFKKVQYFEELINILTGHCKVEFLKFYFNMKQNSQLLMELNSEIKMDSKLSNIICNVKDCLEVVPRADKINYLSIIANEFPKGYINSKGLKCSNTLFFKAKKFSKELKLNLKSKCELQRFKKDQQIRKLKVSKGSRHRNSFNDDLIDSFEFAEAENEAEEITDINHNTNNSTTNSINLEDNEFNPPSTSEYSREINFVSNGSLEKIWIDDSIDDNIRLRTIETNDFGGTSLVEFDEDLPSIPANFDRGSSSTHLNRSPPSRTDHTITYYNSESDHVKSALDFVTANNDQNLANPILFLNSQNRSENTNPHT
jgi:hypothetical protein